MVSDPSADVLVTGSSGMVGRRVVAELQRRAMGAHTASRSGSPPFEWTGPGTWPPLLAGVRRLVLISPEGVPVHPDFVASAARAGVERVALLSDRGAEVMGVERLLAAEELVRASGLGWTVVRPDWFDQNFDESFFRPGVMTGLVTVPIGEVRQGFVDAGDIAAVLVAALLDDRHAGQTYELTGPAGLSFAEALAVIGAASGRRVRFAGDPDSYRRGQRALDTDPARTEREVDAFARLAARGDTVPTGHVEQVLGRPGTAFEAYAQRAAAGGAWA